MKLLLADSNAERAERIESRILEIQPSWSILVANDRPGAVEIVQRENVNAIVASASDALNVRDLLIEVRRVAPAVMRVAVLCGGLATPDLVLHRVAHRVKILPLDPARLVDALISLASLERLLESEGIRLRSLSTNKLPTPPTVALEIMRTHARGTACYSSVASLLHGAPAVAAKVMQLSNSAYYARGTPVLNIERALARLGMETAVNLILAAECLGDWGGGVMQHQALTSSQLAARILSDVGSREDAYIASTAATMADIGLLLPMAASSKEYSGFAALDAARIPPQSAAGAFLLARWGLPWPIVEAVAFRHFPSLSGSGAFGIAGAVHVACGLVSGTPLDEGYLESRQVLKRLRHWKKEAERLGATAPVAVAHA